MKNSPRKCIGWLLLGCLILVAGWWLLSVYHLGSFVLQGLLPLAGAIFLLSTGACFEDVPAWQRQVCLACGVVGLLVGIRELLPFTRSFEDHLFGLMVLGFMAVGIGLMYYALHYLRRWYGET